MPKFIYMEAAPALSGKARQFGRDYRKMAVIELEPGFQGRPKMISERSRGVRRIVACSTEHVGKTTRSAGRRTWARYQELVKTLNAGN